MAFDLGAMLRDVSELDTGREQIEYIPLDLIDSDPNNFYQLTDIDKLADNISFCGLQQPIRVRQQESGRYMIVSGHRRRAALEMLVADGHERFQEASCIVERDEISPALQQLRLIYANANTRRLTPAELSEQAVQVEKLLYQLKEEGYDFPGRMRDHVAEAVGASKTKLARLKVIRENLAACWVDVWKDGIIGESVAYNLSQMPKSWQTVVHNVWGDNASRLCADTVANAKERFQRVTKIQCRQGLNLCEHTVTMMEKNCKEMNYVPCNGCCLDCTSLQTCKSVCPQALSKQKEVKATAKKAEFDARRAWVEKDRSGAIFARLVFQRVREARLKSGVTVEELVTAEGICYSETVDVPWQTKMESGKGDYTTDTTLPFGHSNTARNLMKVVAVADALHCSVDYLLGRTDRMELVSEPDTVRILHVPDPDEEYPGPVLPGAWYPASVEPPSLSRVIVVDDTGFAEDAHYLGSFELDGCATRWGEVIHWCLAPGLEDSASVTPADPGKIWQTGDPWNFGEYVVLVRYDSAKTPTPEKMSWTQNGWDMFGSPFDEICPDVAIVGWMPMPEEDEP